MVSGVPPVLARKLRYFEDRNFLARILAPASTSLQGWLTQLPRPNGVLALGAAADSRSASVDTEDALDPGNEIADDADDRIVREFDCDRPVETDIANSTPDELGPAQLALALDEVDPDIMPGY